MLQEAYVMDKKKCRKKENYRFSAQREMSEVNETNFDFLKLQSLQWDTAFSGVVSECLSTEATKTIRVSHALRRVPAISFSRLVPLSPIPKPGDIVLAQLETIGKNTRLELASGRASTLHVGDLLAVVFGNRYATMQFEGYARSNGNRCELLSMGGMCGLVESKHMSVAEASKLRLIGALADANGRSLNLNDFSLPQVSVKKSARVVVVCGTSMDAGKTHTAMSLIIGLRKEVSRVAGIKLTGTAAGKDTWNMLDAGASPALDFVDGGVPSTYLSTIDELLKLNDLLVSHASLQGADFAVVEIADGLLEKETASLLQTPSFVENVDAWVFAAGESMAAAEGVRLLRLWGIEPLAVSGKVSMSPLGIRETEAATGIACMTAVDLQAGKLNGKIIGTVTVSQNDERLCLTKGAAGL
jgi:hypothetical protein